MAHGVTRSDRALVGLGWGGHVLAETSEEIVRPARGLGKRLAGRESVELMGPHGITQDLTPGEERPVSGNLGGVRTHRVHLLANVASAVNHRRDLLVGGEHREQTAFRVEPLHRFGVTRLTQTANRLCYAGSTHGGPQ